MEQSTQAKPKMAGLAIASLVLGLAALIPSIGVIAAILAIVFGLVALNQIKKKGLGGKSMAKAGIILGIIGIIITGYLFFKVFGSSSGTFAELKPQASQQILTQNAGQLELYKNQYGKYPESINAAQEVGFTLFPTDHYLKPLYYKSSSDGQSYELRSLGADGEYGSDDDILPLGQ